MGFEALKVGELAKRTGLTIRTLHHYDEIGLLKPSLHTAAGHRLYTAADIARLQQVLSLRQLGFSLEQVRDCLDRPGFSPLEVIRLHVARLREQIELQRRLCAGLEAIAGYFQTAGEVSAETFLQAIEVMTMIENYYTQEQMDYFRKPARRRPRPAGYHPARDGGLGRADGAVHRRDAKRHRPGRPECAGVGEAPAGSGKRRHRRRSGDRAESEAAVEGAGRQAQHQFAYDPKVMEYLGRVAEAAKGQA